MSDFYNKSAKESAKVFQENYSTKQFIKDIYFNVKNKDNDGLKGVISEAPNSLKGIVKLNNIIDALIKTGGIFKGTLSALIGAGTALIKVSKELWKAYNDVVDSFRETTSIRIKNNNANIFDKALYSTINGLDTFKRNVEELANGFKKIIATTSGISLLFNAISKWKNFLADIIEKFGNKQLADSFRSNYTLEEQTQSRESFYKEAINSGADKKSANQLANKQLSIMNSEQAKYGDDKEKFSNALNSFIYGGDTKGLQELGFGINDYVVKALMYEQGFDISGNTKYMESALAGGRMSVFERLTNISEKQLQELTQQGLVLDSINQNFAWEEVETISGVNTDAGHYDNNGNWIVSGNAENKEIENALKNFEKSISNRLYKLAEWSPNKLNMTMAMSNNTNYKGNVLPESEVSKLLSLGSYIFDKAKELGVGHSTEVNVKVSTNDEKFKAEVTDIAKKEIYKSINNNFTSNNSTGYKANWR